MGEWQLVGLSRASVSNSAGQMYAGLPDCIVYGIRKSQLAGFGTKGASLRDESVILTAWPG